MKHILFLATLLQSAPPPTVTVQSPPVITVTPGVGEPAIARFIPNSPTCGGVAEETVFQEEPIPAGLLEAPGAPSRSLPDLLSFSFRVAADGRPVSIKSSASNVYPLDTRDVAAALATWRFQPGKEREECQIGFTVRRELVREADVHSLYRYLALQRPGTAGFSPIVGKAAFERTKPAGSDCGAAPRANVREQHHPAFENIPQAPGTLSFSFMTFDIAPSGSTENVRLAGSSGNAELDRQALAALGKWRFGPLKKAGCTFFYFRQQNDPLPPPEPRPPAAYRPSKSTCTEGVPAWRSIPTQTFPPAFQRRFIEGWAVIGYDIAPWGEAGNVKILASEPAEDFGKQAARMIAGATKPAGSAGFSGCVQFVRFKMPPQSGDAGAAGKPKDIPAEQKEPSR